MMRRMRRTRTAVVFLFVSLMAPLFSFGAPVSASPVPEQKQSASQSGLRAQLPAAAEAPAKQTGYTPLVPARLADTRPGATTVDGVHEGGGAQISGTSLDVRVVGRGGVPSSGVAAVVVNITAVSPASSGYVTAFPAGLSQPLASNLNFDTGDIVANQSIVRVEASGAISLFTSATTDLIVDVVGYIDDSSAAGIMSPARLADTRPGSSTTDGRFAGIGRLGGERTLSVSVLGRAGVPASGVQAAILTVTAVQPSSGGYLTVFPNGHGMPNASSVNYVADQIVANQVIAGVGVDGKVNIFSSADTDLIVDIAGWVPTGTDLHTQNPSRLVDTRSGGHTIDGQQQATGAVAAGAAITVQLAERSAVPANGFGSVILNVTAVGARSAGYLTVFPAGQTMPNASSLNFEAGQTIANQVIARVGTHGELVIFTSAETDLIVDVAGWLPPGTNQADPRVIPISDPETPVALLAGGPGTGGARLVPPAGADLRVDDFIAIITDDGRAYYGQVSTVNVGSVDTVEVPLNKLLPTAKMSITGDGETGIVDTSASNAPDLQPIELAGQPLRAALSIPRFGAVECKAIGGPTTVPLGLEYQVNATSFVFNVDWGFTGLNSAKIGYQPSFSFQARSEVEVGIKCAKEMDLATWELPTIRFAIAGIPVVITQEIKAKVELELEAKAGADFDAGLSGYAFAGVVYDGSWHLAKELQLNKRWKADNIKVSAELKAALIVEYEAALYGILKLGAGIGPEITAKIEPQEDKWLTIEAALKAEAKAGIELDLYLFTYEKEVKLAEVTLLGPYEIYSRTKATTLDLSTSVVPSDAVEGNAYSGTLNVTGGRGSSYTYTPSNVPPGLSISGTGASATISGNPTTPGRYLVRVTASEDGATNTEPTTETFEIVVAPKLKLMTAALPAGEVGATYDRNVVAAGGKAPYTFQVTGLPAGLSLAQLAGSPVAQLTGSPTTAGTSTVRVRVDDAAGSPQVDTTFTLTIAPPIEITNPTMPATAVGAPFRVVYTATKGVAPYRWTTSGLPVGTTAVPSGTNGETLTVSGTPTLAYAYSLRATATDAARGRTQPSAGSGIIADALTLRDATTTVPLGAAAWQGADGTLAVKGGVAPYSWTVTGLPTGLTFATGQTGTRARLSGQGATAGSYTAHLRVTDSAGSPAIDRDITVIVADSLRIVTTTVPDGATGAPYSTTLQIAGGTAPYAWTIARIPDGLTLSGTDADATRTLSGAPTVAGAYQMTLYVKDASGRPDRVKTYSFSMALPLALSTTSLPSASINRDYAGALEVTGGIAPYTWTVTGLPSGLALDSNTTAARRTFVGQPAVGGFHNVTVSVSDASGAPAVERSLSLNVISVLTIDATSVPRYVRRTPYSGQVLASGGVPPLTYSATGLPNGLTISSTTGAVTGSFQQEQTVNVVFKVTDNVGVQRTQNAVMYAVEDLAVSGPAVPTNGFVTTPYAGRVTRTGGLEPFAFSATGLPAWATLDQFGKISGTPGVNDSGVTNVVVKVESTDGQTKTFPFTLTVGASQPVTLVTSGVPATGVAGQAYAGTASFTGGNAPKLSMTEKPSWATFDAATGKLTGTPPGPGDYVATFRLTDVANTPQAQTVTIVVTAPAVAPFTWVSSNLPDAVTGTTYPGAFEVSGGLAPFTWTVTGLPAGLALDSSATAARRTFTGQATTASTSTVTVHVSDSIGSAIDKTFTVKADSFVIDLSDVPPMYFDYNKLAGTVVSNGGTAATTRYRGVVKASGGVPPYTFVMTNSFSPLCCGTSAEPRKFKLDPSTGVLTGEVDTRPESTTTTFTVTDSANNTRSQTLAMSSIGPIVSLCCDYLPMFNAPQPVRPTAFVGQQWSGKVINTESEGLAPYTWTATGLPAWATITGTSNTSFTDPLYPNSPQTYTGNSAGLITGIPGESDIGSSNVTVYLTGADGYRVYYPFTFTLTVAASTTANLTVSAVPGFGTVGSAFTGTVTATGNIPVLSATQLPSWATFTPATGKITGTPTAAGDYVATFKLTDGSQPAQTRSVAIKVSDPLAVPTAALPTQLAKSTQTSFIVTSTGGRAPITWSITNLPAGLTASGATVSGTPTTVETKTVSLQATDADGRTKTSTFSLQVVDVTPIVVTVTGVPQTPTVGQAYTGSVTASGGIAPLTYTASNLPAGLTLNATTGALTGNPASPGLFTVVFRANGGFGSTGTATRIIGVQNTALTATVATLPASIDQGVAVNATSITVTGGTPALDGSYTRRLRVCLFNCTSLTAGNSSNLTLDDIDGIVGPVTMATPGDYWVSVVVTDAAGRQAASNVQKITVMPRLTVNTTNLPVSVNKRAYYVTDLSQAFTAEAGKTYAWSATGLPPGVTLNPTTSKLEGTVTTAGTFNAVITLAETTTATAVTRVASAQYAISVAPRPDVISVSAGVDHSCAVYAEHGRTSFDTRPEVGRVLCWGHANNGQLGRKFGAGEPSTGDLAPVEVTDANGTTLTTMTTVHTTTSTTAGQQFSCSNGWTDATINGTTSQYYVWCWGFGGNGQLGADEFGNHTKIAQSNHAVPVQLWVKSANTMADTGTTTETWTNRSTFSGALNVGTDAVCSTRGICLGPDSTESASNEVQTIINTYRAHREFRGDSGYAYDVTSGDGFVCQVQGSVQCQGDNSMGQLGNGSTTAVSAPNWSTPAGAGGGQYARVFSAGKYACSLPDAYNGSTPVCWGDNTGTQLGRTTGDNKVPGAVKKTDGTSLTNVNHLSLGVGGGCATTLSGEYWCWGKWGSTTAGTVGLAVKLAQGPSYWDQWNTNWGADLPGYKPGLGYPSPIAVHQDHVIYIDANGIVRSFGDNDHKQLNRGSDPTPATDPTGTTDI
jgi:hypothetical protein